MSTPPTAPQPQRILLVTGLLGAGKTTALRTLEDLGWEAIDNFPIRLLDRLLETEPGQTAGAAGGDTATPLAIGFDTRTRGFDPQTIIERVKALLTRSDLSVTTLFLDCGGAELERRYNETRRRHPMSDDRPAASGIAAERELLAPLRRWADVVISTTDFTTNDLQQAIRQQFAALSPSRTTITVSSFGFSRGTPPRRPRFRHAFPCQSPLGRGLAPDDRQGRPDRRLYPPGSGLCRGLRTDSRASPAPAPRFEAQGKAYVHIAFGCTGGRHRSVFMAEQIAQGLRDAGFSPTLLHRNLASRGASLLEGAQAVQV
jgi:UPF0042 nucleotide-binding protein